MMCLNASGRSSLARSRGRLRGASRLNARSHRHGSGDWSGRRPCAVSAGRLRGDRVKPTCARLTSVRRPQRARPRSCSSKSSTASAGSSSTSATPPALTPLFRSGHQGTSSSSSTRRAQPSHDWAARDPQTDFRRTRYGTLNLLEQRVRTRRPTFASPRRTRSTATARPPPLEEQETRLELPATTLAPRNRNRTCPIDQTTPLAVGVEDCTDLLVRSTGHSDATVCLLAGCVTVPARQRGADGFLAY